MSSAKSWKLIIATLPLTVLGCSSYEDMGSEIGADSSATTTRLHEEHLTNVEGRILNHGDDAIDLAFLKNGTYVHPRIARVRLFCTNSRVTATNYLVQKGLHWKAPIRLVTNTKARRDAHEKVRCNPQKAIIEGVFDNTISDALLHKFKDENFDFQFEVTFPARTGSSSTTNICLDTDEDTLHYRSFVDWAQENIQTNTVVTAYVNQYHCRSGRDTDKCVDTEPSRRMEPVETQRTGYIYSYRSETETFFAKKTTSKLDSETNFSIKVPAATLDSGDILAEVHTTIEKSRHFLEEGLDISTYDIISQTQTLEATTEHIKECPDVQ